MRAPKVLHAGGYWATNIGNAFYGLGINYLLGELDSRPTVYFASDQPDYAWKEYNNEKNASFRYLSCIRDIDYLVLTGPVFYEEGLQCWEKDLAAAEEKGTKIIFLSAGGSSYTKEEIESVKTILARHKLYALFSRDHETYENYRQYFEYSYDGICCAFFIPEYFEAYQLEMPPYVVFNFETYYEPVIDLSRINERGGVKTITRNEVGSLKKIKPKKFLRPNYNNHNHKFGEFDIVRTKHTVFPPRNGKYLDYNVYVSDVPYDYLNIYANAEMVFSDRVHACVAALSQGTPAMLFSSSPRANLFHRIGADDILKQPTVVSETYLQNERKLLRAALNEVIV